MELPKRKANRLPTYDYAQNGAYFITICTQERQQILWADNDLKPAANTDEKVGASIARPFCQLCNNSNKWTWFGMTAYFSTETP